MVLWRATARSFPLAHRIPDIEDGAPPRLRWRDKHSTAGHGFLAPGHHALRAAAGRIHYTQILGGPACAAPTISASSPVRPTRPGTPGTPAKPESPSILCASNVESTQNIPRSEPSTVRLFYEFPRSAEFLNGFALVACFLTLAGYAASVVGA